MGERDPVHCDINFHACIFMPSIVSDYLTFTPSKFVEKAEQSYPHSAEWQDRLLLEPKDRPKNELCQPSRTRLTAGRCCEGGLYRPVQRRQAGYSPAHFLSSPGHAGRLSVPRQGHVTGRGHHSDKGLEAESRMCV